MKFIKNNFFIIIKFTYFKGTYDFANGDSYEGYFVDGKREGKGIYTWSDKSYYKGDWAQDRMSGKGLYCLPNGETFEGVFENDNIIAEDGTISNRFLI